MKAALDGFQWGTLDNFRLLVDELEMRGSRVQGRDRDWDEKNRERWESMEEVYAAMADRGVSTPDEIFERAITSAFVNLRLMLGRVE